jgi:hypothetical protein
LVSTHSIIIQDRYTLTEEGGYSVVKAFAELAEESYLESEQSVSHDQSSIYSIPLSSDGNNWN